jgi:Phosphatidylglycerol lysyltransferase, C-terminal
VLRPAVGFGRSGNRSPARRRSGTRRSCWSTSSSTRRRSTSWKGSPTGGAAAPQSAVSLYGDRLAARGTPRRQCRRRRPRRGRHPRLPPPRSQLGPARDVPLLHAPGSRHPERVDGVRCRPRDRVPARPPSRGGFPDFAAFARWIARPGGRIERALGRTVSFANPFFQIESLHRFNAKFGPRWEPRYLLYERRLSLPRVGLAALRIEGQLPKLRS